jgi:hypothetical protein
MRFGKTVLLEALAASLLLLNPSPVRSFSHLGRNAVHYPARSAPKQHNSNITPFSVPHASRVMLRQKTVGVRKSCSQEIPPIMPKILMLARSSGIHPFAAFLANPCAWTICSENRKQVAFRLSSFCGRLGDPCAKSSFYNGVKEWMSWSDWASS